MKKLFITYCLIATNAISQSEMLNVNNSNYVSDDLETTYLYSVTGILSSINITTNYYNIKKLGTTDKYRSNAFVAIGSGLLQTSLAFVNLKNKRNIIPITINVSIGLITIATSINRLIINKRKK